MNRRGFLQKLGFSAGALIPLAAAPNKEEEAVGPVLLERVCDGGKAEMLPEDWAHTVNMYAESGRLVPACGTKFRWYWGMNCCCPTCGRTYIATMDHLKQNKVAPTG